MTLRRMIRKMHLRPGDIIVVRQIPGQYDHNLSRRLSQAGTLAKIPFDVPIVEVPDSKRAITIMQFAQLEQAYKLAKEAHERRETETKTTAGENQEGTRGETIRPFAGGGTPANPMSS